MYPANSYAIRQATEADSGTLRQLVAFPRDPNAPGGPRRSDYVRSSVAARSGPVTDHPAEAQVSVRFSSVVGDDLESLHRLASLHDRPALGGPVVPA